MSYAFAALATLFVTSPAEAVDLRTRSVGDNAPPARIADVAFLAGRWIGSGLGGCAEESLSPPVAGQMMGMFRQTKADGALWFYEFYLIMEKEGSLVLRLKHFNPDMTGWEEKDGFVEFPLVAIEENAVYFDGLTYQLAGEVLRSAVSLGDRGAGVFSFHKAHDGEGCE